MLAEYARFPLFGTVGIDSSFYGTPKPATLARWAKALPPGFRAHWVTRTLTPTLDAITGTSNVVSITFM